MNIEQARENMLKQQIHTWEVIDPHILDLFRQIPRELFAPAEFKDLAFADINIPLGYGQTMMTPKEEARILQALAIKPTDKILVLGTGSGYLTALLARLGAWVYSIDSIPEFTERAQQKLEQLAINNVICLTEEVTRIWPQQSPYDVVLLTGSLLTLSQQFSMYLTVKGRLFVVLGNEPAMEATIVTRLSQDQWEVAKIFETVRPRLANYKEPRQFNF